AIAMRLGRRRSPRTSGSNSVDMDERYPGTLRGVPVSFPGMSTLEIPMLSSRSGLIMAMSVVWMLGGCASDGPPRAGTLAYDKSIFTALLTDHEKVRRTVNVLPNGIESVTESDDPAVAARLVDHVTAMKGRLHDGRRVRQWDPLFI